MAIPTPVSYWKFEGNSNDSVGSNNGTDTAITYGSSYGRVGQGASFNGTSSAISFGDPASLRFGTGAFSLALWVYVNGTPSATKSLWNKDPDGSLFLSTIEANRTVRIRNLLTGLVDYYSNTALTLNAWNLVVFTRSAGGTQKIWINGKLDRTDTGTSKDMSAIGTNWTFGSSGAAYPTVYLDESGMFNVELTEGQISQLWGNRLGTTHPFTTQEYIAYDSYSQYSTTSWSSNTSPATWAHVCDTSPNRAMVVHTFNTTGTDAVTGVAYNSVAFTKALDWVNGGFYVSSWVLANPTSGSNNISVTWQNSSNGSFWCGAQSYTGVTQSSFYEAANIIRSAIATSGSISCTSTGANNWMVGANSYQSTVQTETITNGTNRGVMNAGQGGQLWDSNGGTGVGSYTITSSGASNSDRFMHAVILKPYSSAVAATSASFLLFLD